jgi:hypothetical protein
MCLILDHDRLQPSTLSVVQHYYNRAANDSNQIDTVPTCEGAHPARFIVRAALGAVTPSILPNGQKRLTEPVTNHTRLHRDIRTDRARYGEVVRAQRSR